MHQRHIKEKRRGMLVILRREWKLFPATMTIIAIAIVLFVAVTGYRILKPDDANEALRRFGVADTLVRLYPDGTPIEGLVGPFDLWAGEGWRIPVAAWHHGSILHLIMNCLGIWFLGRLLEPRMGRLPAAIFFCMAAAVSLVPSYIVGYTSVGLSGAIYAQFGALMILRMYDEWFESTVPEGLIIYAIMWLPIGVLLAQLEIMPIDNVGHVTGLLYGLLVGWLFFRRPAFSRHLVAAALTLVHVGFVIAGWYAVHPQWNARYHWYLAVNSEDPAEQLAHMRRAVETNTSLQSAWAEFAIMQWSKEDSMNAWGTVLEGLKYNPTRNEDLRNLAWMLWWDFDTPQDQQKATEQLFETFGDNAMVWHKRLELTNKARIDSWLELIRLHARYRTLTSTIATAFKVFTDPDLWGELPVDSRQQFVNDLPIRLTPDVLDGLGLVSVESSDTVPSQTPTLNADQGSDPEYQQILKQQRMEAPPFDPDDPQSAAEGQSL